MNLPERQPNLWRTLGRPAGFVIVFVVGLLCLGSTGCIKLVATRGELVFREQNSPIGKPASYEIHPIRFERVFVDGLPEKELLASVRYASSYTAAKADISAVFDETLRNKLKSSEGAPWIVEVAMLTVETDETTGWTDDPKSILVAEASVIERASNKVVDRFQYRAIGRRTGMYRSCAFPLAEGIATFLSTGMFPGHTEAPKTL